MKPRIYWCKKYKRILPEIGRYAKGCDNGEYCSRCENLIRFKSVNTFMRWANGNKNKKAGWQLIKLREAGYE
jgi:hypothetical protein